MTARYAAVFHIEVILEVSIYSNHKILRHVADFDQLLLN